MRGVPSQLSKLVVAAAVALAANGCATAGGSGDSPEADAAGFDPRPDSGSGEGGEGDGGDGADAAPSGGELDPDLEPAAPDGAVCATPGNMAECPGGQVCRFFDDATGRCESCSSCGNLGASCSSSDQCDILFTCYQGSCTNFCTLGTTECGPPEACLDIGHPERGVCAPL